MPVLRSWPKKIQKDRHIVADFRSFDRDKIWEILYKLMVKAHLISYISVLSPSNGCLKCNSKTYFHTCTYLQSLIFMNPILPFFDRQIVFWTGRIFQFTGPSTSKISSLIAMSVWLPSVKKHNKNYPRPQVSHFTGFNPWCLSICSS